MDFIARFAGRDGAPRRPQRRSAAAPESVVRQSMLLFWMPLLLARFQELASCRRLTPARQHDPICPVQPLEPPDTHYLLHAVGWMELGNLTEAKAELAQVRGAFQGHPDVLEVRWQIYAEDKQWEEGLRVARALIHAAPERSSGWLHQAYALRRVRDGGLHQAWEALLPAFERFPRTEMIAYNLSCYACQMRQMDAARLWLKRALSLGPNDRIKQRALEDADLEPLWDEIKQY